MLQTLEFLFTPTGEERRIHIYLPDDYQESSEHYPVMYFLDGHNIFNERFATYGVSWGLADYLKHWWRDMIIVGIECGHAEGERLREYLPYSVEEGFLSDIVGYGQETARWLVEELKPFIDTIYRSQPFRETTGIAGSSLGGLMSLYILLNYNDRFSKAACLSPAIFNLAEQINHDLYANDISPDSRVYLSLGTNEVANPRPHILRQRVEFLEELQAELNHQSIVTQLHIHEGGQHNESSWGEQNGHYLGFLWDN